MAAERALAPFLGVNRDLSVSDLPNGMVTSASNVRFREGTAEPFLGHSDAYATAPIAPVSAFPVQAAGLNYWLVLGLAKAYAVTGTPAVWTDVTRTSGGDYAATLARRWNGGVLNGVPIVNNGIDVPQMWSPAGPATKLQALTAWPANTTARILRPFGVTMVALDLTVSGTRRPHLVRFSHPADPGTVPPTWDVTDATKLAGERDLEGASYLVDGLTLRESFIIYKQNSTHRMSYVGGTSVYGFTTIFSSSGMLAPGCAVEVDGNHVVLTNNDVIIHDGNNKTSVVDKTTRRWLFQNINQDAYDQCFLVKNVYFNEVWVCFPELTQTKCTKALVYNYKDKTISFRDLPNVVSGNTGQVDNSTGQTWDGNTQKWDEMLQAWDENEFGAQQERTMFCAPDRPSLVLADSGTQFFGQNVATSMERVGLTFGAPNFVKTINRLHLRVKGPTGSVLLVKVGGQLVQDGPITWSAAMPFRIGIDGSVGIMATGSFLAYRITSQIGAYWRLEGGEPKFSGRGQF